MGLKDRIKNRGFVPIDLNEENVLTVLKRCLADDETFGGDTWKCILFRTARGFESDSLPVYVSNKKLEENAKQIRYLYGQTHNVHSDQYIRMTPGSARKKYTGEDWTTTIGPLYSFLVLLYTCGFCSWFEREEDGAFTTFSRSLKPTLSPKDPNFPAWWEEHKAEWEDKK